MGPAAPRPAAQGKESWAGSVPVGRCHRNCPRGLCNIRYASVQPNGQRRHLRQREPRRYEPPHSEVVADTQLEPVPGQPPGAPAGEAGLDNRTKAHELIGSRLREARLRLGLGVRELSRQLDISASSISQIELGRVVPSVSTLYALTNALNISMDSLFVAAGEGAAGEGAAGEGAAGEEAAGEEAAGEGAGGEGAEGAEGADGGQRAQGEAAEAAAEGSVEAGAAARKAAPLRGPADAATRPVAPRPSGAQPGATAHERSFVLRRNNRRVIDLEQGVRWELLTPVPEPGTEFLEVVYPVGSESSANGQAIRHNGRDYCLVLEGRLRVQIGFDEYVLNSGDSLAFDATIPHRFWNAGDIAVRAVWFVLDRWPPHGGAGPEWDGSSESGRGSAPPG
jgi:transcriptional regulator with XRE-family HTH domain/quercetin dioxygenase-like cupin family protein